MNQVNQDLQDINTRLDNLSAFLREHVVTRQELKEQLDQVRSEVATKAELRALTNSIDAYAKLAKDYFQEVTVMSARLNRMEDWIQKASAKIGLDYRP